MKKYLCPLCSKESAYISEYGLADSVICKCQGLKEVGRLVNGVYQPSFGQVNQAPIPQLVGQNLSGVFLVGDFAVAQLKTDAEVKQMGQKFKNALENDSARADYMKKGTLWVALHQKDDSRSIIFFIDNQKRLQNFYLARNASPSEEDRNLMVAALQKKGLIS